MSLRVLEIELRVANHFVAQYHRHHKPDKRHKFSLGCLDSEGLLRGVAICGRPKGRWAPEKANTTLEVTRVATDGKRNACSILYGAARREAIKRGFRECITYTRADEPGTSLRAAGWKEVAKIRGRHWDTPTRRRKDSTEVIDRVRWHAPMPGGSSPPTGDVGGRS